jgi:hypothetical protein
LLQLTISPAGGFVEHRSLVVLVKSLNTMVSVSVSFGVLAWECPISSGHGGGERRRGGRQQRTLRGAREVVLTEGIAAAFWLERFDVADRRGRPLQSDTEDVDPSRAP